MKAFTVADITPFETNLYTYFNQPHEINVFFSRKSLEEKKAIQPVGTWNPVHLLCCVNQADKHHKSAIKLFKIMCDYSSQNRDTVNEKKRFNHRNKSQSVAYFDMNRVIDGMAPIDRLLLTLDSHEHLICYHQNRLDSSFHQEALKHPVFSETNRPLYLNKLIYCHSIISGIKNFDDFKTTTFGSQLLEGLYLEPDTHLLESLLKLDGIEFSTPCNQLKSKTPFEFCCLKGYANCIFVFKNNKKGGTPAKKQ